MGMPIGGLRAACAALAASEDAGWREEYARECTGRLTADGPTWVREGTFGDLAEVVEVDPSGILWVVSAFDGRRYWTRSENLMAARPPNLGARVWSVGPSAVRSAFGKVDDRHWAVGVVQELAAHRTE